MSDVPEYLQRAFDVLKRFNEEGKHHGVVIGLGTNRNLSRATVDLSVDPETGERTSMPPALQKVFDYCGDSPILFERGIYRVLNDLTDYENDFDSLLCINTRGRVIPFYGHFAAPKNKHRAARILLRDYDTSTWGTRHWDSAAASGYRGVVAMVLSERHRTITTLDDGNVIPELCYHPRD